MLNSRTILYVAEFFYKRGKSWISNTSELPEMILSNRIRRCWSNLSVSVQIISEPSGNFEANFVQSRFTSFTKELWYVVSIRGCTSLYDFGNSRFMITYSNTEYTILL